MYLLTHFRLQTLAGNPVTFASTTQAVCATGGANGAIVTIVSAGTCALTADQAGGTNYTDAAQVMAMVVIARAAQTISGFNPATPITYQAAPNNTLTLSGTATSGLAITFATTTPTVCTVTAATATILSAGTCTLTADQAGNTNYNASPQVSASIVINKANQIITFTTTTPIGYQPAPNNTLTLSASSTSTLPVIFASTAPAVCTTSGANGQTVTILSPGICSLTADQAGDTNFNAATQVTASIVINKATQTITFAPATPITYQPTPNNTITLSGTATSGLSITFASTTPTVCTVNGNNATILTAGTCTLTADQAGDVNTSAAPQVTASITITAASQTITGFNPPASLTQPAGSTYPLSATGGASGQPVTFSSSTPSVCATSGGQGATLTVLAAGSCTITANQAGNAQYAPAAPVTVSIALQAQAQIYFIHADHLGTPRAITKATDNTKVWEWKNDDPFGNNQPDENPNGANGTGVNAQPFKYNLRFPGQYYDQETGTSYNYFRDYDPSIGRYVQSDPIGLRGGLSTFAYVHGNPISLSDTTGLYSSGVHRQITDDALRQQSSCSKLSSGLANQVAAVDWQGGVFFLNLRGFAAAQNASNAISHGMRRERQDVKDAEKEFGQYVDKNIRQCTQDGLAHALHALQDSTAEGHKGFPVYHGPWDIGVRHIWNDAFPKQGNINDAISKSLGAIRTFLAVCPCYCK